MPWFLYGLVHNVFNECILCYGNLCVMGIKIFLENIFKFLGCTDSQKVNYAAYMFEGYVEIWWKSKERLLLEGRGDNAQINSA